MDKQEERKEEGLSLPKDTQINLVVNNSDMEEDTIDLGRVFRNFKEKRRVFAWLLLFCLIAGISAALLMYQINKKPLTVASVVTLRYLVDKKQLTEDGKETGEVVREQVSDLTSPDGKGDLDLSQVSSAYVLQNALSNIELSKDISISALRGNIQIQRIPAEESRRQQELINSMMENNTTISAAFQKAEELELKYSNQFIVSLTNGFGNEDDGPKIYLEDGELSVLLDQILDSYNDYLVRTYGQVRAPGDEVSIIDTASLDTLESLDMIRSALKNLEAYCEDQQEEVKAYRSWMSGLTLEELAGKIRLLREVNTEYLFTYVNANGLVKSPEAMLNKYQYELRNAQAELNVANENIAAVQRILDNYRNDDVYVSTQESDATKTTQHTTDYYNELVLSQTENYKKVEELQTRISDLEAKITNLKAIGSTGKNEDVSEELEKAVAAAKALYLEVSGHMNEYLGNASYRTFAEASVAQGKTENFLTASMKNMLMFGAVGAVLALVLWFFSALAPEFRHREDERKENKKVEGKGKEEADA